MKIRIAFVLALGLALTVFGCGSDDAKNGGGSGGDGGDGGGGSGGEPVLGVTCDPSGADEVVPCVTPFIVAADCTIFGAGVPIPLDPVATPSAIAYAGVPLDITPQATITLPAALVCGFTDVIPDGIVSNSQLTFDIANPTLMGPSASTQLVNSFLDDGTTPANCTPGTDCVAVSPHLPVTFDFFEACGNAPGTCASGTCSSDGTTSCTEDADCAETGPGITASFLPRTADPAVPGTITITPGAPGTINFTYEYETLELPIDTDITTLCIGGLCSAGVTCPLSDRTGSGDGLCGPFAPGDPDACGPNDSPRLMYDGRCDKLGAVAGTCSPFEDFQEAANICATGQPGTGLSPEEETGLCGNCMPEGCGLTGDACTCDQDDCCAFVQANYPTATPAQFPRVPVTEEPGTGGSGGGAGGSGGAGGGGGAGGAGGSGGSGGAG